MKHIFQPNKLPFFIVGAGGIGLALRLWLLGTADSKGFLASGHISEPLCWILTVLVIGILLFGTRDLLQASKYHFNFPPSLPGGIGTLLAAIGIAITALIEMSQTADMMTRISCYMGLIGALSLIFIASSRWKGFHLPSLPHVLVCLFLMLRLICLYRHWSADPQLQDYCFEILATVCLMLATYHRATFDANFGKRRPYAFFSLLSVYFCCLSLTGWENIPLYLGAGVWMLFDLCSLTPMPDVDHHPFHKKQEEA